MNISYTAPLSRAWARMKALLFRRPFEIETWIVVAFSAWLAEILSSAGGGSSRWNLSDADFGHGAAEVRDQVRHWLEHPAVLMVIASVLLAVLLTLVLVTWLSARAQFVFLDNVLAGRPAFVAPWRRSGRLANSLFLWWAALSFAWLLPIGILAAAFWQGLAGVICGSDFRAPELAAVVLGVIGAVLTSALIALACWLTTEFVVPLMARYDESATRAWARFWPLLTSHVGDFIAYAAFVLLLTIGVTLGVLLAGFLSCCVGLVLLMIPYVGTLVTLPIHVTGRGLGPEFLRQFGPEWDVFAPYAPDAVPAAEPLASAPPADFPTA